MKHLLLTTLLLFGLNACGEDEKKLEQQSKQLQEAQAQKESLLAEMKAKDTALAKAREENKMAQEKLLVAEKAQKQALIETQKIKDEAQKHQENEGIKNTKLAPVGVEVDNHKITIDTQKTKDFFEQLSKTFEKKINKIAQDLEKGTLEEKDAGVKIDDTHINIDLNKTKEYLESWGKKMQDFVQAFDGIEKSMDTESDKIRN